MSAVALSDLAPRFARELQQGLRDIGDDDLAGQVPGLRISSMCGCGDGFCASFYTTDTPDGGGEQVTRTSCHACERAW